MIKNSPKAEHVVADKGYDSDTFREKIEKWEQIQQSQEGRARRKVIRMLIGAYIDTDIWLRMHSVELKIIEQ